MRKTVVVIWIFDIVLCFFSFAHDKSNNMHAFLSLQFFSISLCIPFYSLRYELLCSFSFSVELRQFFFHNIKINKYLRCEMRHEHCVLIYLHKYNNEKVKTTELVFLFSEMATTTENEIQEENNGTFQNIMRHIMSFKDNPISILLIRHPPVRTSIEASNQRQVPLHSGAKAMLVCQKNTEQFTLVILPAHLSCDTKKIASALGIPSSKLRMANEEEVRRITGCIPGAVPPFGALFPQNVKTLIDIKMSQSTSHPPPLTFNPEVQLFSINDPEWPSDLANVPLPEPVDQNRTDCINFNIGLRTVSCSIPYSDYLRILGEQNYSICDISK